MDPNQTVEREVTITNVGDEPITVAKIYTECGCTTAVLAKRSLEPGEGATLGVGFNSKGFCRAVRKHVFVDSNDPRGVITVTLQPYVREGLRLSADTVRLGRARAGQTLSGDIYILQDKGMGTPIIAFRGVPEDLKVATGQWEDMGEYMQCRIAMTASPANKPAGFYRQLIEVLVGDSPLPLMAEYELLPRVQCDPGQVRLKRRGKVFEDQVLILRWPSSTTKPTISVSSVYGKCRPTLDSESLSDCRIRVAAREEKVGPLDDLDIVRVSYTIGVGQQPETLAVPVVLVGHE